MEEQKKLHELTSEEIIEIEKDLGIYGHDEGLTESEYRDYLKTKSTPTPQPEKKGERQLPSKEYCRNLVKEGIATGLIFGVIIGLLAGFIIKDIWNK